MIVRYTNSLSYDNSKKYTSFSAPQFFHHFYILILTTVLYGYIYLTSYKLMAQMFEFCCSNKHYVITVFRQTFLCLEFMFLISLMICVSRNLCNALSWHQSRWKNRENSSVAVNRFLLRSSIKARQSLQKRTDLSVRWNVTHNSW